MSIINKKFYNTNGKLKKGSHITLTSFFISLGFGIVGLISAAYHLSNKNDENSFYIMLFSLILAYIFNLIGKKLEKKFKIEYDYESEKAMIWWKNLSNEDKAWIMIIEGHSLREPESLTSTEIEEIWKKRKNRF